MRLVAAALLAATLAAGVAGCGGDDRGGAPPTTATGSQEDTTVPTTDTPTAPDGVSLSAAVRLDRRRVLFDYTLANTGAEPVAVVDPTRVIDTLDQLADGVYRAGFLRNQADPAGGSPLPFLEGVIVAAGGELTGTAGITGQFDELPEKVQLCIEVVPQPWTDAGGGVAQFPYGTPAAERLLACTEQLAVPSTG
jgi:hypothetical protein